MANYRRARMPGGCYFFTVVSYRRQSFLTNELSRKILWQAISKVKNKHPFHINAWVLLPDHMHCIWTLPTSDDDFPKRWGLIKAQFSKAMNPSLHNEQWLTETKRGRRESTIWQRRFWEHRIRDEQDYRQHIDYIHFNPVKHGLVSQVKDWPYSTFHRYVKQCVYPNDWGENIKSPRGNYGE